MLGRQSRPAALVRFAGVVFAHQLQHSLANFRRLGAVRYPAHVGVLQCFCPSRAVAPPDPLALAITAIQHPRRLAQLQLASLHPAQHLASSQFLVVHPCPLQSRLLLRSLRLGDISIALSWGHYHRPSTGGSPKRPPRPFPEGGARVQVSRNGGRDAVWNRDGQELFFVEDNKLMLAQGSAGERLRSGRSLDCSRVVT